MATIDDVLEEDFQNRNRALNSSATSYADLVPSNWCDPLLTGPSKVLPEGYTYGPKDIERLLLAIKQRIADAEEK